MWEIISAVFLIICATFGFVALVKTIIFKTCKPESENTYLILKFRKEQQDIEYILRSRLARASWLGKNSPDNIIIINNGLNKEQKEICSYFCKENDIFKILSAEELCEILEK